VEKDLKEILEEYFIIDGDFNMEKCSNCGLESKYLYGPMADLCKECYNILGHTMDPQISQEEIEQNLNKRGDIKWKE